MVKAKVEIANFKMFLEDGTFWLNLPREKYEQMKQELAALEDTLCSYEVNPRDENLKEHLITCMSRCKSMQGK